MKIEHKTIHAQHVIISKDQEIDDDDDDDGDEEESEEKVKHIYTYIIFSLDEFCIEMKWLTNHT